MEYEQTILLPELDKTTKKIGPVEEGYRKQIKTLEESGAMGPEHAGTRALVLNAARAVDNIKDSDAASGRSNLLKALNDIAQRLPIPTERHSSLLEEIRALMLAGSEVCPYDNIEEAKTA